VLPVRRWRDPPQANCPPEFQSCPPLPLSDCTVIPLGSSYVASVRIPQSPRATLLTFRMRHSFGIASTAA
jgi:hypothetical protein